MTDLDRSMTFCVELSKREARNFYYSFMVLPAERRRAMCALYAFMRKTDDLADQPGDRETKAQSLRDWRHALDDALEGRFDPWPGFPALAQVVDRYEIPARYLHEVIDGVEMDLEPRPFPRFLDLKAYCHRVASVVGLSCLHIWGYRTDEGRAERLADACGLAFQLTNIIRDVREDALQGRIYLPTEDLERFGVEPTELLARRPTGRVQALLEFEGRRAYEFYHRAEPLLDLVDPVGRPVLLAMMRIYRGLLDEIVRRDYDVMTSRVALSPWRKLAITFGALPSRFLRRRGPFAPFLDPVLAEPTR